MRSIQARPPNSLTNLKSKLRLSKVCMNCRQRHLKCTGGPLCQRCLEEGETCIFPASRQGQRTVQNLSPLPFRSEKAIPGATCTTCRERHLKCNGEVPCKRCYKDHRPCVYQARRRVQRTAEDMRNHAASSLSSALAQPRDSRSVRSYQFFCENTARQISGPYDQELFTTLVLQISQSQDAIRHAVVALGALHEVILLPPNQQNSLEWQDLNRYALVQCNEAIQRLKPQPTHQPSTEIILLSSILFMQFENMRQQRESETALLFRGLNILCDYRKREGAYQVLAFEKSFIYQYLAPVLTAAWTDRVEIRNDGGTSRLQVNGVPADAVCTNLKSIELDNIAKPILSMSEARMTLDVMTTKITIAVKDLGKEPDAPKLVKIVGWGQWALQRWHLRFLYLLDNNPYEQNKSDYRTSILLRIHHKIAVLLLTTVPFRDESLFDSHIETCQQIVLFCQELRKLDCVGSFNETSQTAWVYDAGILRPLYIVASRCRDPLIRRDAINTLYNAVPSEQMYSFKISAMIADEVRKMEEKDLGEVTHCIDIPVSNRVFLSQVCYDPGLAKVPIHDRSSGIFIFEWLRSPFSGRESEIYQTRVRLPPDECKALGKTPWRVHCPYELQSKLQLRFNKFIGLEERIPSPLFSIPTSCGQ